MLFISYSRSGVVIAHLIRMHLETRGYKVFMDLHDLGAGDWREQIRKNIVKCSDILVLVSADSVSSREVASELDLAFDLHKPIIPVVLEEVSEDAAPWLNEVMRHQAVPFDEKYPHQSMDALQKLIHAKRSFVPKSDIRRFEFLKDTFALLATIVVLLVLFFTNPRPEIHLKMVARGPFAHFRLDHELFYEDRIIYSELYAYGKDKAKILFSYGFLGKVFEADAYRYNLQQISH